MGDLVLGDYFRWDFIPENLVREQLFVSKYELFKFFEY